MTAKAIENWHRVLEAKDPAGLAEIIADDCTFWSPVVHTGQEGKAKTVMYLTGAFHALGDEFTYVREVIGEKDAVLEFTAEVDGIHVNGVDMISWNDDDMITDFKVMVRPMKGMMVLKDKMAALLEQYMAAKGAA